MRRDQTDQETDHQAEGVTIAAAAHRLGVSENAIRQRIKRESIEARKIDGVWQVWLPAQADHQATLSRPLGDQLLGHEGDHESSGRDKLTDHEATGAVATIPALIAQFESIRDQWLRPFVEDLNVKSERIGQLQERLATTEQRLAAAEQERDDLRRQLVEAAVIEQEDSLDACQAIAAPEAPQSADVAPHGAEPAVMGQDASPSFIAALLRRLLRRDPP